MVLCFGVYLPVLVPVLARTQVDVIPPVRLVPKQLSFIQVIRIISIITKVAVTLAVLPLVSNRTVEFNINNILKKRSPVNIT